MEWDAAGQSHRTTAALQTVGTNQEATNDSTQACASLNYCILCVSMIEQIFEMVMYKCADW